MTCFSLRSAPVVCAGVLLLAVTAHAQERPVATTGADALTAEAREALAGADTLLRFRSVPVPGGRRDPDARVLRAAYRLAADPAPRPGSDPRDNARDALARRADAFGWADALDDLALRTQTRTPASSHLRFQQTFRGLPVFRRTVQVNLDAHGQPTMILSAYAPHLRTVGAFETRPSLPAAEAEAVARGLFTAGEVTTTAPELVVYPAAAPRLAWHLVAWPRGTASEWSVLLDAQTGAVLDLVDQSTHAREGRRAKGEEGGRRAEGGGRRAESGERRAEGGERNVPVRRSPLLPASRFPLSASRFPLPASLTSGSGLVFDPDPLTTAGVGYGAPYEDAEDADVAELNAERVLVTLPDITQGSDGLYRLKGPFAAIDDDPALGGCPQEGGCPVPPAEGDPDGFRYSRSDDRFEAVMAYYHVDKSQRYVQSLDVGRPIQAVPVRVNPHGLGNRDDSRYYPGANGIAFGDGGIDDAEDADVIWHEYGHALLEGSAPGLLATPEGQALHEGWADYWAASYSRVQIESGAVPPRDWRKVFTWDGNNGLWQGRRLDHTGIYPVDTPCARGPCGSGIYTDGLLWATTLMEVYDDLGRTVTDRLNLASHGYLNPPVTFADAAEALLQADRDLYDGAHLGVLIQRLGARGFVDPSSFGPTVAHEPLPYVEQEGSTVRFDVLASSVTVDVASVVVVYRINDGAETTLVLIPEGGDRYAGTLTLPPEAAAVAYYVEATDANGQASRLPFGAPEETFSFGVGPDTEAPRITHVPIESATLPAWPVRVTASIQDNQGVARAWVQFSVTDPDGTLRAEDTFDLTPQQDRYVGTFPQLDGLVQEGTHVTYSLHARDVAKNANETVEPASGTLAFILVAEGVVADYDFETDEGLQTTGTWEHGTPAFGIRRAHSGARVWGTNLTGAYPAFDHHAVLELPGFDLSDPDEAYLVFWHWYDFEHSGDRVFPDEATTESFWDGANVKVSTTGGTTWTLAQPIDGYNGVIEAGTGNPLQGEPAFGGFSYGWRRVVIPLPTASDVRVRFDFGSDGSNELNARFYAGWYLDDVRITTVRPSDNVPPTVTDGPPAVLSINSGQVPPAVTLQVEDNVGVAAVWSTYTIERATGGRQEGTERLTMSATDLATFEGDVAPPFQLGAGDRLTYRFAVRDFDGNEVTYPSGGDDLQVEVRLAETLSALRQVRASGLWAADADGWTARGETAVAQSSLVLAPIDLPENADQVTLRVSHAYDLAEGVGGNLKVWNDDDATWSVVTPAGGYGAAFPTGGHPDAGAGVFAGRTDGLVPATFDLSAYAGRQVRLRFDFSAVRPPASDEFWRIASATVTYATGDDAFDVPLELALHPNFPDPFLDSTTFSYTLPEPMPVTLELYNILGQRVGTLVDGDQDAGTHTLTMSRGSLASGVYLLRMLAGGKQMIERMVIAR